jgi:hypothetical protein
LNDNNLTYKKIFKFWVPLFSTWLMMSVEGPFLAALIARLPEPKFNLAAYGIAFAFALIVESPIIMMLSASTAIVEGKYSFQSLKKYAYTLSGGITVLMLVLLIPPVFNLFSSTLLNLPGEVANLAYKGTFALLPWPGAIGYRRFYQGVLIKNGFTKRVAYGTAVRLLAMSSSALILFFFTQVDGVLVGTIALSCGVVSEAIAIRIMSIEAITRTISVTTDKPRSFNNITQFYYPLAMTAILALGVQPVVTFFVGTSRLAIESLAVLPVLNSFIFIFRSVGLSFQEVGIALVEKGGENFIKIRNYARFLGGTVFVLLAIIAFTPLSNIWFGEISGLKPELIKLTIIPLYILLLMPTLSVILNFERSMLVKAEFTKPITAATSIEIISIVITMYITISIFDFIGIYAASLAFVVGRALSVAYLSPFYFKVTRNWVN